MLRWAHANGWTGRSTPELAEVAEAAEAGDPIPVAAFRRGADYLATGITTATILLDLDLVVIAGGVSAAGEVLLAPLREAVSRDSTPALRKLRIRRATLGRHSGLIGAARHAQGHWPDAAPRTARRPRASPARMSRSTSDRPRTRVRPPPPRTDRNRTEGTMTLYRLDSPIRTYAWGSHTTLADLQGRPARRDRRCGGGRRRVSPATAPGLTRQSSSDTPAPASCSASGCAYHATPAPPTLDDNPSHSSEPAPSPRAPRDRPDRATRAARPANPAPLGSVEAPATTVNDRGAHHPGISDG